ncbi:hypothetical protein EST38_g2280 [Candolleomyces aberdarensis]|uniref:MYND-type domain-containing protein n=1 Tax=Candolleomyces aberdarensis TaxID=2316362 RepID=A0A4Q2DT92_9AGAR|nr:hypothetical protein EST38_g2280 [Candolleomyces aberdarensis]
MDPEPRSRTINVSSPGQLAKIVIAAARTNPQIREGVMRKMLKDLTPVYPPLESLPCANAHWQWQAAESPSCNKPGKLVCGSCRLTAYCSRECQKAHWKAHKKDCKSKLRDEDWQPSWGTTPAMDVLNLEMNEKDLSSDLNLAFIASGDLRNVVKTINSLPSEFSGRLTILLNDAPPIASQNLLLLTTLATVPDEVLAADIALHYWYSAFLLPEYEAQVQLAADIVLNKIQDEQGNVPLGEKSTLGWYYGAKSKEYLWHCLNGKISEEVARTEYTQAQTAISRRDHRERFKAQLRPSHRVAFEEYRRSGIVRPFGVQNPHFTKPNLSLFTLEGKWWQSDSASPLNGWDPCEVIKTGKRYGAQPEDIFGCLYFFLSEQLRTFARRIREMRIAFKLFCWSPCEVGEFMKKNVFEDIDLPSATRFDRIDVSNIMDQDHRFGARLENVLEVWGSLLSERPSAALVGCFIFWFVGNDGSSSANSGEKIALECTQRLVDLEQMNDKLANLVTQKYMATYNLDAVFENSKAFIAYLRKNGLTEVLEKTNLKLRDQNTILPHVRDTFSWIFGKGLTMGMDDR